MKVATFAVGATLCFFLTPRAGAQITRGTGFLHECRAAAQKSDAGLSALDQGAAQVNNSACAMYVFGLFDGIQLAPDIAAGQTRDPRAVASTVCAKDPVTAGQLRDILVKYIEDNPSQSGFETSLLALFAFQRAFPCKAGQ